MLAFIITKFGHVTRWVITKESIKTQCGRDKFDEKGIASAGSSWEEIFDQKYTRRYKIL